MALVKSEVKGEIRVVFIDVPQFVDGGIIQQCTGKSWSYWIRLRKSTCSCTSAESCLCLRRLWECWFACTRSARNTRIALKLCNISSDISEVFKITALDKVFSIYPDASDAMQAFAASGELFFRKGRETRHELT